MALQSLRNWQEELKDVGKRLSEINEGIGSAAGALEILLETPDERPDELFSPRSEVSSFHYSPRDCDSNHDSPRDGNQQRRKRKYGSLTASSEADGIQKFEYIDGVPLVKLSAPRRRMSIFSDGETDPNKKSQLALRLLGPWQERFAVGQEEAIATYNEFFCGWDRVQHPRTRRVRLSSREFGIWCIRHSAYLQQMLLLSWSISTLILVFFDTIVVPITLGWPHLMAKGTFLSTFYQVTPAFWILDVMLTLSGFIYRRRRNEMQGTSSLLFSIFKLFFDMSLVAIDIVLLHFEELPEALGGLKMLRLLRTAKFPTVLSAVESHFAARGSVDLFSWAGIFEGISVIILVNHGLACGIFYVGRLGKTLSLPTWLDDDDVVNHNAIFQYMTSFNLVLAQYTPAPYNFQPRNELEQAMTLVIILTCLPLLGAQIGKISLTLNVLKEKSTERDRLRRDLQRWLRKTSIPVDLNEKMLRALDDVLNSTDSPLDVKDPMALTFLPSTLIKELRVVKTGEQLQSHRFFNLLMDDRLQVSGRLTSSFRSIIAVLGEEIYNHGRKAEGLYVTLSGRWKVDVPVNVMIEWPSQSNAHRVSLASIRGGDGLEKGEDTYLSELSLYTELKHSTTLSTLTYAKALVASPDDFINALVDAPPVVVAIHEYALCLLQHNSSMPLEEVCWELVPEEEIELAVRATQVSELLQPQQPEVLQIVSRPSNFDSLRDKVKPGSLEPVSLSRTLRQSISELGDSGIYQTLKLESEALNAIHAIQCALWLLHDDFDQLVSVQKKEKRLTYSTWANLRGLLDLKTLSWSDTLAVFVLLAIRGLPKCKQFQMLCPPIQRHSREKMVEFAISSLGTFLPSVTSLPADSHNSLAAIARMLCEFNFAQFMQGENNPHSIYLLQEVLREEGQKTFQIFLFAELCILCSVGHDSPGGSVFLDEKNARVAIQALQCLQNVLDSEPDAVYWRYIGLRARALNIVVQTPEQSVIARLICLTRCMDQTGVSLIEESWGQLSLREKQVLLDVFLMDGHHHKAFVFCYLPLFLTQAINNPALGLKVALAFIVDVYHKLIAHRCFDRTGPTVQVDIGAIAMVLEEVDEQRTLSRCLDYAQIVKARNQVTLHLTGASYQVLSGQLVHESRHTVLLEHLATQQLRVEALLQRDRGEVRSQEDFSEAGELSEIDSELEPVIFSSF